MSKRTWQTWTAAAVAAVAVLASTSCSGVPSKPDDPVEFVTTWLDAVVNHDKSAGSCEVATEWMTDHMTKFGFPLDTCQDVAAVVELPAETKVEDLGCQLTDTHGFPGWSEVACGELRVSFTGEGDGRMIEDVGRV